MCDKYVLYVACLIRVARVSYTCIERIFHMRVCNAFFIYVYITFFYTCMTRIFHIRVWHTHFPYIRVWMGLEGAFLCDIYISYVVCLIDVAYSSYAHMDEASERVYV